jgi:hypothetical protein
MLGPDRPSEILEEFDTNNLLFMHSVTIFMYSTRFTWWWPLWAETYFELINKSIYLCDGNPYHNASVV